MLGRNDFLVTTCTRGDVGTYFRKQPERETAANRFAVELLLPASFIYEMIRDQPLSISTARLVAEKFNVSLTAAAIQCVAITDQACAVVVTIDGIVRYFRPSKLWTRFIQVDCSLGKGSVASRLDLVNNEGADVVNICAWGPRGRFDRRDEVLENSIYLPTHNTILTCLSALS